MHKKLLYVSLEKMNTFVTKFDKNIFRYEFDDPGIESRWGGISSSPVHSGCEAYPNSYTMVTGSFPG
jgi:hypothetical protein